MWWIGRSFGGKGGLDSGIADIAARMAMTKAEDEKLDEEGIVNKRWRLVAVVEVAGHALSLILVGGHCG